VTHRAPRSSEAAPARHACAGVSCGRARCRAAALRAPRACAPQCRASATETSGAAPRCGAGRARAAAHPPAAGLHGRRHLLLLASRRSGCAAGARRTPRLRPRAFACAALLLLRTHAPCARADGCQRRRADSRASCLRRGHAGASSPHATALWHAASAHPPLRRPPLTWRTRLRLRRTSTTVRAASQACAAARAIRGAHRSQCFCSRIAVQASGGRSFAAGWASCCRRTRRASAAAAWACCRWRCGRRCRAACSFLSLLRRRT
jgi:hypothetical protein